MAVHPLEQAFAERVPSPLRTALVARFFGVPQTLSLLAAVERSCSFTTMVRELAIEVESEHTERIPADGALVVFANHPFPMVDLSAVASVLERVRPDSPVRVVVDPTSDPLVELHPLMLFVGTDDAERAAFWEASLQHLESGGTVLIFPSGRTVVRDRADRALEPPWRAGVLKLAAKSGAPLLPVHIEARTGWLYNTLRRYAEGQRIRALNLTQVHRRGKRVRLRFGAPLRPDDRTPDDLRRLVYSLAPEASFQAI